MFGSGLKTVRLLLLLSVIGWAQQFTAQEKAVSANEPYRIHSGDKLSIRFPYHAELNEPAVIVRPDGMLTLSMIDDVKAAGLTVAELKRQIEKAYGEVLLNPVVSVNLLELVAPRVFVGGQVNKAGSIELRAGQTLLRAIMLAGGFTNDANRRLVLHARPAGDGKLRVTQHDALRMLANSKTAYDLPLQDGDYIFVPDSKLTKFARVMDVFRSVVPGYGLRY
jgi:polysaccharide export outer membrane protein